MWGGGTLKTKKVLYHQSMKNEENYEAFMKTGQQQNSVRVINFRKLNEISRELIS